MDNLNPKDLFGVVLKHPQKEEKSYRVVVQVEGQTDMECQILYSEIVGRKESEDGEGDVYIVAPRSYLEPMGFPMDNPVSPDYWTLDLTLDEADAVARDEAALAGAHAEADAALYGHTG